MIKSILFISIIAILMGVGLQSVAATQDIMVPRSQVVMKPPDIGLSPPYSLPSIVIPVTPESTSPEDRPVSGIAQSLVLSGSISPKVEPEQLITSTNITQNSSVFAQAYIPDRVIVKFKTDLHSPSSFIRQIQAEAHAAMGATVLADTSTLGVEGMQVVNVPNTTGTMKAIELYRMNPMVEYAQPDYLYSINSTIINTPLSVNTQLVPDYDTFRGKPSSVQVPNVPPPSSSTSCPTCSSSGSQSGVVGFWDPLSEEERYNTAQAEVDEINAYVKEHNLSWTAAVNPIMLMSPEEREHLKGLRHDLKSSTIMGGPGITPMEGLPTSFDWRNNGGDYTTPIKNQGSCGSCWAFATTGAFESYKEIKSGNPGINPDYAEQYLVNCAGDQSGCNGGLFTAMAYFVNKAGLSGGVGTVTEANYPYTASGGTCKSLSGYTRYSVDTAAGETWGYVGGGNEWSIPSDDAIKTAIYLYGPVAAGVYAESTFDSYRSGILDSTSSASYANHAIIIVGWGTLNGRTYWICKNSWGTSWGESGWFRIYSGRLRIGEGAAYFKYTASNPSGGTIAFSSTPSGAQIWVDGVNTGQVTPYTQTSVPIGTYSVTLKLSGYLDYTRSVSVTSGQTTVVSATLSPIPTGSIAVSSTPSGARIWLDGVDT
ncbi:C1 family peptidase, partial [Methanospirillum hungatei]|uniref:C1 family peptidase n=1 Tax=Methanospirillum hungatei TaxID=2203 RepID=UPI0026F3064A